MEAARECEEQTKSTRGVIRAVSVAVPGTVDVDEGVVVKAPNVPCLDGFRLAAALESELHWPAIVENDANAAAVGEMWQGAATRTSIPSFASRWEPDWAAELFWMASLARR